MGSGRHAGIEVENLDREFKKGLRAVDGINLQVEPGEIYGFLGPNGAGKSTTVLVLTTLLPPTSGIARVAGFDVVRECQKVRAAIGAALQEAALDPLLTGREHLKLQAALHGLSRVGQVPGFDFSAGYTAFQFVWSLLQAVALGGAFTGFSIAGDFESGFARRLLLAASDRRGIVLGYVLASLVRATVTGSLVTVVALLAGMRPEGGVDLFGLVGLALLINVAATLFGAGVAMLFRTQQAGPVIWTPIFLVLFLAPVFVPQQLLAGWISAVAAVNPMTIILEAGRGFVSGEPTGGAFAFAVGIVVVLLLGPWALFGLRRAEKAG
ncbi:MAG: type transport system permease protein [Rubrobacteraceae bacterium]|nr:type transport system permease protein [Rubrobacteraceae bacterium]